MTSHLVTMDYDQDELNYSSEADQEQFNEEALSNEEYDKLYDSLDNLKRMLVDYNPDILSASLKEILYFNYYEVEPSFEEVKATFKRSTYTLHKPNI